MAKADSTTKAASASNKVSFTAGRVSSFKCAEGKKDSFLWDEKQPGLGLLLQVRKPIFTKYGLTAEHNGQLLAR